MKNKELEDNKQIRGPKSRTLFKDTLTRALLEEDGKRLRKMTERLIALALDNSLSPMEQLAAIKLIIERVDGRAPQAIEVTDVSERPEAGTFRIVKIDPNTAQDE